MNPPSIANGATGASRTTPLRLSEASQREAKREGYFDREDIRAKLVLCVNTNICGKRNPTHVPGYGFAYKALDAISVLGPQWLALRPGPCFVRCSSGVNGRLLGNKTAYAALGLPNLRSRDLFRLNSIDDCVKMLELELEWSVDTELLSAYRSYAAAVLLLDDSAKSDTSLQSRAASAKPMLDTAASYALAKTRDAFDADAPVLSSFARVASAIAAARQGWSGSRWRESFYKSEMGFVDGSFLGDSEVGGAYGKQLWKRGQLGSLQGVAIGGEFRGRWREEPEDPSREAVGGVVALRMSSDGLSFKGVANADGDESDEPWEWEGERIRDLPLAARPENINPRRRWYALVLILRSQASLLTGNHEEALCDAVGAVCLCMYLPEAWGALSEAALQLGDKRTAVIALSELWWLKPKETAGMPPSLAARRRELGLELDKLREATGGKPASSATLNLDRMGGGDAAVAVADAARAADEARDRVARAIFVDEYAVELEE